MRTQGRRGNVQPISEDGRAGIARLLAKALNKNQRLILDRISLAEGGSLTSQLRALSAQKGIPLSTLKLNAKVLGQLGLISAADHRVRLNPSGFEALKLLRLHDEQTSPNQEVN